MVDAVGAKNRSRLLRNVGIAVVAVSVCVCLTLFGLFRLMDADPTVQATRTARANGTATQVAFLLIPSATPTPLPPTETSLPTATQTKTPTSTPTLSPETATAAARQSATAASQTPIPTPTETEVSRVLGLSLTEFVVKYEGLTDLQREAFIAGLPGKTVDWTGKVYDVDSRGIFIDMPGSIWNGMTVLTDVPADIAITVNKDSRIRFKGTIDHTANFIFFYIYISEVEVIQ
jgi:hypothetical protein